MEATDTTYIRRWLGDVEEGIVVGQLIEEGSDQQGYDEASAYAALDSMVEAGEWVSIAAVYERATGFNPFKQGGRR